MHVSNQMQQYHKIAEAGGYHAAMLAGDYKLAALIVGECIAYLKTLDHCTRMYGDHYGWTTAGQMIEHNKKRILTLNKLIMVARK